MRANESVRAVPSDKCLDLSILCDAEATPSSGVNTTTIGGSASSSNVVFIVTWKPTPPAKGARVGVGFGRTTARTPRLVTFGILPG